MLKLNETINQTRKVREESHTRLYRFIEELQTKFAREITVRDVKPRPRKLLE